MIVLLFSPKGDGQAYKVHKATSERSTWLCWAGSCGSGELRRCIARHAWFSITPMSLFQTR